MFALLIVGSGVSLIVWHLQQRSRLLAKPELTAREEQYYRNQCRRRVQVAGMLIVIGVLIPGLFLSATVFQSPLTATICLLLMIGLLVWMCILAIGDYTITVLFHQRQFQEFQQQQEFSIPADPPVDEFSTDRLESEQETDEEHQNPELS